MNRKILCLVWCTIICLTNGQLNGDPAPGRSPGPPDFAAHSTPTALIKISNTSTVNNSNSSNQIDNSEFKINDVLFDTDFDDKINGHNDNQQTFGGDTDSNTPATNSEQINSVNINMNNATNELNADAENILISDRVTTELPIGRKPCNSVNTLYDYINNARIYHRKLVVNDDAIDVGSKSNGQNDDVTTNLPSSAVRFDVTHEIYDIDHGLVNNVVYVGKSRLNRFSFLFLSLY